MKYLIILFLIFISPFGFAQKNKDFKQPFFTFKSCLKENNKKQCFDDLITSKILEVSKQDLLSYHEKYPECGALPISVSFVIGENGKPIVESIRTTKNDASEIDKKLKSAIETLPEIVPLRNEFNHEILSYYYLYLEILVDENNELQVVEKSTDAKEFTDHECCKAPVYPGCDSTSNKELKQCFSNNVTQVIGKKFNTKKAFKNFYKKGTFYTYILFQIDSVGEVNDVVAFGPNENISEEAIRSLGKLKRMEPATKNGVNISIPFILPLKLQL